MLTLLHERAAVAGGNRGSRTGNHGPGTGNRGPTTAGWLTPRPPARQLAISGLGGAARANDPRPLAKPAVAGPRTGHDRPQGVPSLLKTLATAWLDMMG